MKGMLPMQHARFARALAFSLGAALAASPAPAQPADAPPPPAHEGAGQPGPTPEQARAFVQRRLDAARDEVRRAEEALRLIDSNASPEELRRALGDGREPGAFPQRDRRAPRPDRPGDIAAPGAPGEPRDPDAMGDGRGRDGPRRAGSNDRAPGGPVGPGGPRGREPLNPEARERILAFLREHNPQAAERIEQFRRARPMVAERMLAELGGQLHELREIRQRNPKMFEVRLHAFRLDWEMRDAAFEFLRASRPGGAPGANAGEPGAPPDIEALRARLTELADKRFAVSVEEKALQIADMNDRLERLQNELNRAGDDRAEAVRKRVDAMIDRLQRGAGEPGSPHDGHADRPDHAPEPGHPPERPRRD